MRKLEITHSKVMRTAIQVEIARSDESRYDHRLHDLRLITGGESCQQVADDNAYAEALFRTAKYRPEFPARGFADLAAARAWGQDFVHWYNVEHRHSGIRYVSPAQRDAGEDKSILAARQTLYQVSRATEFSPVW